jgi:trk system potassium uptake protein TrkA
MFVLVAGGGKVGANIARTLRAKHEVVLIESDEHRYLSLEDEFGHRALHGDATELFVLERAGIERPPDILVAATGDDEDNIVICQLAQERYHVQKVVARVNDLRNQQHFDLLGIAPTVSATASIMALIEHELPAHTLVRMLELRKENLEIVEVELDQNSPGVGRRVQDLAMPPQTRLISVMRDGKAEIAVGSTELRAGDQVLAILQPGREGELREVLLAPGH